MTRKRTAFFTVEQDEILKDDYGNLLLAYDSGISKQTAIGHPVWSPEKC